GKSLGSGSRGGASSNGFTPSRNWRSPRILISPKYLPKGKLIARSHHRTDDPGREFFLAHPAQLALAPLARGDRDDLLEDLPADDLERRALEDHAAVDVHVVFHVAIHERVRRQLDGRHGLAPEYGAPARREADEIAATGDEARDGDGIVARRVHEDEAARGDRLAVVEDVHHRRGAALGHAAQ